MKRGVIASSSTADKLTVVIVTTRCALIDQISARHELRLRHPYLQNTAKSSATHKVDMGSISWPTELVFRATWPTVAKPLKLKGSDSMYTPLNAYLSTKSVLEFVIPSLDSSSTKQTAGF